MSEGMKAAKATPEDVDQMREFLSKLEEMVNDSEEYDADDIGSYCYDHFNAQCGRHFQRVLFGYDTLIENACDPTLSHLDWKPEIKEAVTAFQHRVQADLPIGVPEFPCPACDGSVYHFPTCPHRQTANA